MTAPHIVDPAALFGDALADASPDLMRSLLQTMINALLSADADAVVGAEYGRPSPDRTAQRNGYRHRPLDTRVGTIDVAVPTLRAGSYFPEWLLARRKGAEAVLITVVADCYLAGVSTGRMDKLVKTLGINSLSKSQVSRMATDLDELVAEFCHRPLGDAGPFTFVAQSRDPPPHRLRRDLPQRRRDHPSRRRSPCRADRRMGRRTPLSRPRNPRQIPPDHRRNQRRRHQQGGHSRTHRLNPTGSRRATPLPRT